MTAAMAGDRGEKAVYLAGQAIRSVALGVVVTAVAQSIIGGVGLAVAGVKFAGLLTALMFVLCLIQLGPALVLIPAVVWVYYSNDAFLGTVLVVFTIVATTIDQFIRPILIRRGAALPLLLNAWIAEGNQPEDLAKETSPPRQPAAAEPAAPYLVGGPGR